MAPPPSHSSAAPPAARTIFDPWSSSATGHQRAENRLAGSMSWRSSRARKLASQFKAGASGGKRLYDTVGAGSEFFGQDGRTRRGGWEKDAKALREPGRQDLRGLLEKSKGSTAAVAAGDPETADSTTARGKRKREDGQDIERKARCAGLEEKAAAKPDPRTAESEERRKEILAGVRVYINGSTAPLVGDHRLKQMLAEHGAEVCVALARKSVTHVILGTPNNGTGQRGAGGGLAAGKIQKEIERVRGKGIKYVGVEWVLESLKCGKRLPEAKFSVLSIAPKGQGSVYGMFKKAGDLQEAENVQPDVPASEALPGGTPIYAPPEITALCMDGL